MKAARQGFERRIKSKVDEARDILKNIIVCHVEVERYNFTHKVQPQEASLACCVGHVFHFGRPSDSTMYMFSGYDDFVSLASEASCSSCMREKRFSFMSIGSYLCTETIHDLNSFIPVRSTTQHVAAEDPVCLQQHGGPFTYRVVHCLIHVTFQARSARFSSPRFQRPCVLVMSQLQVQAEHIHVVPFEKMA